MVVHLDASFFGRLRTALAARLPEFLPNQRWFRSKARRIQSVRVSDCIPVPVSESIALIAFAAVEFVDGPGETYVLPLVAPPHDQVHPSQSVVVRVPVSNSTSERLFIDALGDRGFLNAMLNAMLNSNSFAGEGGVLRAVPESGFNGNIPSTAALQPRILSGEQSNSSVIYGDQFILKFFRRVEEGIHPDLEIGRFLTSVAHFPNVPPLCGSLIYESHETNLMTVGILQRFVPNRGDAWRHTIESLAELLASPDHPTGEQSYGPGRQSAAKGQLNVRASEASDRFGKRLELIGLLGKRTAELHLSLASSSIDPAFAPERFTPEVREEMNHAFHDLTVQNFQILRLKTPDLPESVADLAKEILRLEDNVLLILHSIVEKESSSIRTRIHGDYHLGQVLFTGSDFFIIDFEGEPARPLSQRRNKRSPLQDVAGMLRSFHYAAHAASISAAARDSRLQRAEDRIAALAAQWKRLASAEFLRSYRSTAGDAKFVPSDSSEFDALLKMFLLEKAVYELGYELNNRPSWLPIPLKGIRDILATPIQLA
jgi:maltose alpha-D-glucosyltransferase/alpha-amylase